MKTEKGCDDSDEDKYWYLGHDQRSVTVTDNTTVPCDFDEIL